MRKIATITNPVDDICRAMTHVVDGGVFLFLYTKQEDGPCYIDEWYESLDQAEQAAFERFGVRSEEWTIIDDPLPGAQQDWIRPTRGKRDADGNKIWGQTDLFPNSRMYERKLHFSP